jgi:iron complex transport system substrate-binding protein
MADLYSTQGANTIMRWYTELAGGVYLPKKLEKYFAVVNMEKIVAWDPDIILLGMNGSFDSIETNTAFKGLRASKSGRVYKVPAGIFYWDMTSCETALLPLFLAKKFHPDLFKEWDIIREMREFYAEIYGIDLANRDAERILDGMPPL